MDPSEVINPQSGSNSSTSSHNSDEGKKKKYKALPPLFWYMETGDWVKATDRARRHPKEVKTWATLRTKSQANESISGTKRLALHHACFKLRSVVPASTASTPTHYDDDSFVQVCEFIVLLIELFPEACGMRESRHGCLPLHLAAFASCAPRQPDEIGGNDSVVAVDEALSPSTRSSSPSPLPSSNGHSLPLAKPKIINRSISDNTTGSAYSTMSSVMAEEQFAGAQTRAISQKRSYSNSTPVFQPKVSVSHKSNGMISARREEMAVQVLNALLDAYPKAIKVDSEGGRLPLHTACAGRATPRVISTLVNAYPAAARHRNKDGFLPLHLAAHWGVSHPKVAIALLKAYPDSSLGRNRWERTPLEEALSMAGENGRLHQAALVRALRKHPSYWAKPVDDLFRTTTLNTRNVSNIVDMDETVADDDDETSLGEIRPMFSFPGQRTRSGSENLSLQQLIKDRNWGAMLRRLKKFPHEAGETLENKMTRGGYLAQSGWLPLHYVCEREPPVEVITALLDAWPESVTIRLFPGAAMPIHIACTWGGSGEVVSALSQADVSTCRVTDELGNMPLHHAAFSGADESVVEALLRAYPKAVLARNHQGSLPSDISKRLRHDNRKTVMSMLDVRKEEVMNNLNHRRARSAGSSMVGMAERAAQLNHREGPPRSPKPRSRSVVRKPRNLKTSGSGEGVEVTIEEGEAKKEESRGTENGGGMLWI